MSSYVLYYFYIIRIYYCAHNICIMFIIYYVQEIASHVAHGLIAMIGKMRRVEKSYLLT